MRIVETDNFGRDYPDEKFVNLPSMPKDDCKRICDVVNAAVNHGRFQCDRYWKVVDDTYELKPGFEP